jgi:2-dehydro-3-deoxyphosphooctonate aldolase (KDO 8-P synthase)
LPNSLPTVELTPDVVLGGERLPVVAGPCVIESADFLQRAADVAVELVRGLDLPVIFKSSFDKANRSSLESFRGPGLAEGLEALAEVKRRTGLSLLTDVHHPEQCEPTAAVCDVLQIPAFLCRQTDLLLAAGDTGRPVAIKKGQFMAPDDMRRVVDKVRSRGNERVVVTERGSSFGYHNLVVDMRSFELLHADGIRVLYDVTHSLQLPGALPEETGGDRRFAEPLALAALAAGADGLYMEIHPEPSAALCDRHTQLPPATARDLLERARDLYRWRRPVTEGAR